MTDTASGYLSQHRRGGGACGHGGRCEGRALPKLRRGDAEGRILVGGGGGGRPGVPPFAFRLTGGVGGPAGNAFIEEDGDGPSNVGHELTEEQSESHRDSRGAKIGPVAIRGRGGGGLSWRWRRRRHWLLG